jgi:predicted transglutaminase-like protease
MKYHNTNGQVELNLLHDCSVVAYSYDIANFWIMSDSAPDAITNNINNRLTDNSSLDFRQSENPK